MFNIAQCVLPLKAVRKKDGSVVIICRSAFDEYQKTGRFRDSVLQQECGWLRSRYGDAFIFDIPCGRCINCRLNYARTWSQRCLLEAKAWQDNFFVTLTYDDEHLPLACDPVTGEVDRATLCGDDVKAFMKRLREFYREAYDHVGIRFFMAGEYGDVTARPHYHILLFNLPIYDLRYYSKSPLGDCYYNSDVLSSLWSKGHVVIGELTAQSAAYTARYCQKKAFKDIDYASLGIAKEFVRMSRRPGIALPYFEKHCDQIYKDDVIYLPDGEMCTPFRYFDDKAVKFGIDIEKIKKQRLLNSCLINNEKVDMVSKDYYSYLDDLEKEFHKKSRALVRDKC